MMSDVLKKKVPVLSRSRSFETYSGLCTILHKDNVLHKTGSCKFGHYNARLLIRPPHPPSATNHHLFQPVSADQCAMAQVHSGGTDARRSAMDWKSLKMEEQRRACWAHGEEVEEDNAEAALFARLTERKGKSGVSGGRGHSSR